MAAARSLFPGSFGSIASRTAASSSISGAAFSCRISRRRSAGSPRVRCNNTGVYSRSEGNARLLLALTLLATGCGSLLSARPACERNPALVASVDWSTADLVEIYITREGFEPHQVKLRRNQPAILRVANADDRPRVFTAH